MKASRIAIVGILSFFAVSSLAVFGQPMTQQKPEPGKPAPRLGLPKEIKAIIQEGLVTRQGRQDIPFTIFKALQFPVSQGMHAVLFFKARNADLGYTMPLPARPGKSSTPPAATADVREVRLVAAIEFFQPDGTGVLKVSREIGFPVTLQTESAGYDPAKEDWYSVGITLPYGKYTAGMLISRIDPKTGKPDLRKVGVSYFDVDIPGPETYQGGLETTPIFFARDIRQMESYEGRPLIHRGFFTYSVLQFVPNIDSVVTAEDNSQIEVFFIVLGAKEAGVESAVAPASQKFSIEAAFELQKEDGASLIKWEARQYNTQYVSQVLPLKRSAEKPALAAGSYVLAIKVKDLLSGSSVDKKVPFDVR